MAEAEFNVEQGRKRATGNVPRFLQQSPTVRGTLYRVGTAPVSAAGLAEALLSQADHRREYAGGRLAKLGRLQETSRTQPAGGWIDDVYALIEVAALVDLNSGRGLPMLHGRLLLLGLCLLDPDLYSQLASIGAFGALIDELQEPFLDILSPLGKQRYAERTGSVENRVLDGATGEAAAFEAAQTAVDVRAEDVDDEVDSDRNMSNSAGRGPAVQQTAASAQPATATSVSDVADSVPTWNDDPLKDPERDLLGRRAFAQYLAKRLISVAGDQRAYSIHIYAPWGAGKTTLLNFLSAELQQQGEWATVEFNAWRHQHIRPPWWSLMEQVVKDTQGYIGPIDWWREQWWRFRQGGLVNVLSLLVLLGLLWVIAQITTPLLQAQTTDLSAVLATLVEAGGTVSAALALLTSLWGAALAFNRSLLFGSARSAQSYTELTRDPMNDIKQRFETLIRRVRKTAEVVVFIDDLDRCQSQYVVELLEGIQTLFRDVPVVFVVAADRRWLNACYEEVYAKLEPKIHEPGKPLGTLFLEKAFQFTTPMPGAPPALQERYWRYLLDIAEPDADGESPEMLKQARSEAQSLVVGAKSEGEVRKLVEDSGARPFLLQRAVREAAVVQLAESKVVARLEHTLRPYGELLEPNPRAMKRLVNEYSANRALALLAEIRVDLHQLALWTVLGARWPQLAYYLEENPTHLDLIGQADPPDLPTTLQGLFTDSEVVRVVQGGTQGVRLTVETVKQCSLMRV